MRNKYIIELAKAERECLPKFISAGTKPAADAKPRPRILLKVDIGEHTGSGPALTYRQIAQILDGGTDTVRRERFCTQGPALGCPIAYMSGRWRARKYA